MSRENVEIVRRVFEAWGRGDFRAGTELYDPYTLLVLRPEFLDPGSYCGPDEIAGYMRGLLAAWEHFVMVGEEFLDAGDSVVVGVHQQGTGVGSRASVEARYFQLWTFRGGSLIRIESIVDRTEALEAAGLSE